MPTSYSSNYQIKLIGTGEESSTWGDSTNVNLQKIEQMVGGNATIKVSEPNGASTWTPGTNTLTWITSNTALAGATNSEGRAAFVTFTTGAGTVPDGNVTIEIKGDTSDINPSRVFFVKNALGTHDIDLKSGAGAVYTLRKGAFAVVATTGSFISNILNRLQLGGLSFVEDTTGVIHINDANAAALSIQSVTSAGVVADNYIKLNTTAKSIVLGDGTADLLDIDTATIDLVTPASVLVQLDQNTSALNIQDDTSGKSAAKFDTSTGTPHVTFGGDVTVTGLLNTPGGSSEGTTYSGTVIIETTNVIDTSNQASNFIIKDNDGASLSFRDDGASGAAASYLTFNTTDASEAVVVGEVGDNGPKSFHLRVPTIYLHQQDTDFIIADDSSNALDFRNAVDNELYMRFDTVDGSESLVLGDSGVGRGPSVLDIDIGTIHLGTQVTLIGCKDAETEALAFTNVATGDRFLGFDTTNDRVEFGKPISGASGGTLTTAAGLTVTAGNLAVSAGTITASGTVTAGAADFAGVITNTLAQGSIRITGDGSNADVVRALIMDTSDNILLGQSDAVANVNAGVELHASATSGATKDSFKVNWGSGSKTIWHDDTEAFSTVNVAAVWELHSISATALQIKDGTGGASMMTFNTVVPDIDIHVPLGVVDLGVSGSTGLTLSDAASGGVLMSHAGAYKQHNVLGDSYLNVATMGAGNVMFVGGTAATGAQVNANQALILQVSTSAATPKNQFKVSYDGLGTNHTIWHAGNDGVDSGLDADTVDTFEAKEIFSGLVDGDGAYFESTPFAYPSGTDTDEVGELHGLGSIPRLWVATLRCTDVGGDLGWANGTEVNLPSAQYAINYAITFNWSTTRVKWAKSNFTYFLVRSDASGGDGGMAPITPSKWEVFVRAWK